MNILTIFSPLPAWLVMLGLGLESNQSARIDWGQ